MPSLTPDGFVELNRTFSDFHEDTASEQAAFGSYFSDFVDGGTTWEKLLQHRCVVILAEAGSGKTWELLAQAQRHRDADWTAFFIRLERLAQRPLAESFAGDDKVVFDQWLASNNAGVFFLDAVDEAKLATRHAFEEALRSFVNGIPRQARKRIKVVITSRITGWKNREDQFLLRNLLDLPDHVTADVGENNPLAESGGEPEDEKTVAALRVVSLNPLDSKQIQSLSDYVIPECADEFVQALDDNDAWSFARRPQDVIRLANYWQQKGDLGRLTELLEFDIRSRLEETDDDRLRDSNLTEEQLRRGAEALAAAVVLGKTLSISLEPEDGEPILAGRVIPSMELPDWTPEQRKDLLSRAIFDPAAFGQVRFHHRNVADYLAACWLDRLFTGDLIISDAISMFFVRSLGQEVLIPSRAAVVCWLACGDNIWNQRILSRLLEVSPGALLSQGDGERLDVETRKAMLRGIVKKAGTEGEIRSDASNDQLKRLAHPDLSGVINDFLLDPETTDDGRTVLLRLVREGKITACVSTALELALNPDTSNDILIYSAAVIAMVGNDEDKGHIVDDLLGRHNLSSRVSYILATDYYPDNLTGEQLAVVASQTKNPGRMIAPDFTHGASQAIIDYAPDNHVAPLLEEFIKLLKTYPGVPVKNGDQSFLISRQYSWLAPILRAVVARALKLEVIDESVVNRIVGALILLELAEELDRPYESRKIDLNELSLHRPEVRRTYCWCKVNIRTLQKPGEKVSIYNAYGRSRPLEMDKDDIEWLYEDLHKRNPIKHRRLAMHLANDLWWYFRLGHTAKAQIRDLISDDATLKQLFNEAFPNPILLWFRRSRERARLYFKWGYKSDLHSIKVKFFGYRDTYRLWRTRQSIASGKHSRNLWFLYHLSPHTGGDGTRHTIETVKIKYGKWIAEAYRKGCKALWREFLPTLPHDRPNPMTNDGRVSIGLLGLQFEIEEGLDISTLPPNHASLATRYAVENLSGFPEWLTDLAEAHPEPIQNVLRDCVTADWKLVGPNARGSSVGFNLYRASPSLWRLMAEDLFALISNEDPGSSELLLSTIGVVLRGNQDANNDIVAVAQERLRVGTHTAPMGSQWFLIWLWLDADNALDWLEELSASKPQAEVDDFLLGVGNEMNRENLHHSPTDDTPAYYSPSALCRLAIILYRHIRPDDDIDRMGTGTYSPGARDNAQNFRNAVVVRLEETPGIEAHSALLELAETPELEPHREFILRGAATSRLLDAEPNVWNPGDAADFARTQDQAVRSGHDLFAITLKRLNMIKDDLEDADFRKREGLPTEETEDHLQEWLARHLNEHSQGKFEVIREPMVAYGKEPDIRLVLPSHNPTSIEIKWADDWSYNELCEALSDQLVGRYMRARQSRHGVLLLCCRGKKKHWEPDGEKGIPFNALLERLNNQARAILDERWDIDGLAVICLNFSGLPIDKG